MRRDPRCNLKDALIVFLKVPGEDRFMVRDPVSESAQEVQRCMNVLAGDAGGMRERASESGPPERHLIVGFPLRLPVDVAAWT